jgi:hypothetical protein
MRHGNLVVVGQRELEKHQVWLGTSGYAAIEKCVA